MRWPVFAFVALSITAADSWGAAASADPLPIYREVKIIKETAAAAKQKPSDAVAIVSYDEKPGIQAIATTAPDLSRS